MPEVRRERAERAFCRIPDRPVGDQKTRAPPLTRQPPQSVVSLCLPRSLLPFSSSPFSPALFVIAALRLSFCRCSVLCAIQTAHFILPAYIIFSFKPIYSLSGIFPQHFEIPSCRAHPQLLVYSAAFVAPIYPAGKARSEDDIDPSSSCKSSVKRTIHMLAPPLFLHRGFKWAN